MAKIGQSGHWKLNFLKNFMYFFPHFSHFSLSIDHLSSFNGQKRIQHTKLHRKSVNSFLKINKIVKTGPKIVEKWSKNKLWLSVGYCGALFSELKCHFRCTEILLRGSDHNVKSFYAMHACFLKHKLHLV